MSGANIHRSRRRLFDSIVAYKKEHDGCSPSIADLKEANGITSNSVVYYLLRELQEEGLIICGETRQGRAIQVVGGKWSYSG